MGRFPKTEWGLIEFARAEAPTGSREQMGRLLEMYRQPMYVHLRSKGLGHEQSEDLIQEFMIEILDSSFLKLADPKRGKFRTLLLTALNRFAISKYRYDKAAKRSPGDLVSLDAMSADQPANSGAESVDAFDRAWALDVLAEALTRVRKECLEENEEARWDIFEGRLLEPLLDGATPTSYADLANEHGLSNEKAAMNMLVTVKRQFARTLRELVRDYVTRAADRRKYVEIMAGHIGGDDAGAAERDAHQLVDTVISQRRRSRAERAATDSFESLRNGRIDHR